MNNIFNNTISMRDLLSIFKDKEKDAYIKDVLPFFYNNKMLYTREATVEYYHDMLDRFVAYFEVKKVLTFHAINKQVLDDFVYYSKAKNNKNVYINKMLKALFNLIKFAEDNEYISPLCLSYKRLPEERTQIDIISDQDMRRIMRYVSGLELRSRLMFLLLLSTGIRSSELTLIKIENIDLANKRIYLDKTKTRPRFTPLTDEVILLIQKTIERQDSIWLFPSRDNMKNHITPEAIRTLMRRIKTALNINVLSAHKLRHFYATHLLKNGVDIKTVMRLLGHTTITMTERYLDITEMEMYEKNRVANPLNTFKIK